MEETIDYKTLYEHIQQENEDLRLKLWGLRQASSFSINWVQVRHFVQENYTVLLIVLFAIYYMGSLTIDAIGMMRGKI